MLPTEPNDIKIEPTNDRAASRSDGMNPYIKFGAVSLTLAILLCTLLFIIFPQSYISASFKYNKLDDDESYFFTYVNTQSGLPRTDSSYASLLYNKALKDRYTNTGFLDQSARHCSITDDERDTILYKIKSVSGIRAYKQFLTDYYDITHSWYASGSQLFEDIMSKHGIYEACLKADNLINQWTSELYEAFAIDPSAELKNRRNQGQLIIDRMLHLINEEDESTSAETQAHTLRYGDYDIFSKSKGLLLHAKMQTSDGEKADALKSQSYAIILALGSDKFIDELNDFYRSISKDNNSESDLDNIVNSKQDFTSYLNRSIYYLSQGENDKATGDLLKLRSIDPSNSLSRTLDIYVMSTATGCIPNSFEASLNEVFKDKLTSPYAYYFRGMLWKEAGINSKALEDFNSSIKANSAFFLARKQKAELLSRIGKHTAALREINDLISKNSSDSELLRSRSLIYLNTKDYTNALIDSDLSILANPLNYLSYRTRAEIYEANNDIDSSIHDERIFAQLTKNHQAAENELNRLISSQFNDQESSSNTYIINSNRPTISGFCQK